MTLEVILAVLLLILFVVAFIWQEIQCHEEWVDLGKVNDDYTS